MNIKIVSLAWVVNMIYLTTSIWAYYYCLNINHWASGPLYMMCWSGSIMKVVLSGMVIVILDEKKS